MFTSRAEYRLSLARRQCRPAADRAWHCSSACVGGERARSASATAGRAAVGGARSCSTALTLTPNEAARHGLISTRTGSRRQRIRAAGAIRIVDLDRLARDLAGARRIRADVCAERARDEALYAVYLDRQEADIAAFRRDEARAIPADLDFIALARACRTSLRQKLDARSAAHARRRPRGSTG